jgi:hypothetical protein
MVEFQAPPSAAGGWFSLPRANSGKYKLLPHGSLHCGVDFLVIFALPLLGSLLCQSTESLTKNLCFWSLVALFSVLLTASHGGYDNRPKDQTKAQYGLAANCFLATSLGMLALSVILGHPNILTRHWVAFDLFTTPLLLIAARTLLAPKLTDVSPNTGGPLVICYDSCPRDLGKALTIKNIPDVEGVLYLTQPREAGTGHDWPALPDLPSLRAKLRSSRIRDVIFVYHPALDSDLANMNHALWEEVLAHSARIWLAFDVGANLPEVLREKSGGWVIPPEIKGIDK